MGGPIRGVRVLDLTTVLLGPYCTQILGDLGADIIKIEPPQGDSTRYLGPARTHGMGGTFLNIGRNKKSCVIDLKKPAAAGILERLIPSVDVLIYNMRPAAMERLGITYDWAAQLNPRLLYCGAFGFGEDGPYAGRPAFDDIIQAASGIAIYQERLSGRVSYFASAVADKVTGLFAANAVIAALYERERTGRGQRIDVPMFETMAGFMLAEHITGSAFEPPLGPPYYARIVSPNRKPYRTLDGHIAVLPYNDRQWARFFGAIGQPQLATDPRFADMAARTRNIDVIYEILAEALAGKTSADWLQILATCDIPHVEIKRPEDLLTDPHLLATGFFEVAEHESEGRIRTTAQPVRFSENATETRQHAPRLGQHTLQVLEGAGFTAAEIAMLQHQEVVWSEKDISARIAV